MCVNAEGYNYPIPHRVKLFSWDRMHPNLHVTKRPERVPTYFSSWTSAFLLRWQCLISLHKPMHEYRARDMTGDLLIWVRHAHECEQVELYKGGQTGIGLACLHLFRCMLYCGVYLRSIATVLVDCFNFAVAFIHEVEVNRGLADTSSVRYDCRLPDTSPPASYDVPEDDVRSNNCFPSAIFPDCSGHNKTTPLCILDQRFVPGPGKKHEDRVELWIPQGLGRHQDWYAYAATWRPTHPSARP